jgi:hypothetical protein
MVFLTEDIVTRLKTSDKRYTASTIMSFNTLIKRLYNEALNETTFKKSLLKTKRKKILEYIASDAINQRIKKTMLNAIIQVLSHGDEDDYKTGAYYVESFRHHATKDKKERTHRGATEEEHENRATEEEIKEKFKAYQKNIDAKIYKWGFDIPYLFFAFLVYLAPQRNEEYTSMRIIDDISEESEFPNNFNISNGLITITEHKNKRYTGARTFKAPKKLITIVKDYYEKTGNRILFPKKLDENESMSVSGLTHWINGLFGRKVGLMDIRRSFASDMINNGIGKKKRLDNANIMGHHIREAEQEYSRYAKIYN